MKKELKSTRDGFGKALLEIAKKEPSVVVVGTDLAESTRVKAFAKNFPGRFFEVGVAEQNAAGVAAGLALSGKTVFLCSFASFSPGLNWGQIRQSICMNKAHVIIVGSHAGLATGPDGATHQALEDVALMRVLPEMKVFVPLDYRQTKRITRELVKIKGPSYLRLARPATLLWPDHPFEVGKAEVLKEGNGITLIGCGPVLVETMTVFAKELKAAEIINCPSIKPFDENTILVSARKTQKVITIEDHQKIGGLGSVVAEVLAKNAVNAKLIPIGTDDTFGESAKNHLELWEKYLFAPLRAALKSEN